MHAARRARTILIGALVNLAALCEHVWTLGSEQGRDITFMLAGEPAAVEILAARRAERPTLSRGRGRCNRRCRRCRWRG